MSSKPKAYLIGGGIGSLAAAFMIRDGSLPGIDHRVPPVTAHDKSLQAQFEALIKAFK